MATDEQLPGTSRAAVKTHDAFHGMEGAVLRKVADHLRGTMTRLLLTSTLGEVGLALKVCLTFAFFAMLQQSNLAQQSAASFDLSRHTCRGDIFLAPPGLLILVCWTKTHQFIGKAQFCPSRRCQVTQPTQWLSIGNCWMHLPQPDRTSLFLPSHPSVTALQLQSPCCRGLCRSCWLLSA